MSFPVNIDFEKLKAIFAEFDKKNFKKIKKIKTKRDK